MASPQELAESVRMPPDLKDRGWKLESKQVNDSDPSYVARNEELGLTTEAFPVPFTAIASARKLDELQNGATYKSVTFDLAIDKIRLDGGTQPRQDLDLETINRYAEEKLAGAKFPAAKVFHDGSNYWLADGFHRLFSDRKIGSPTLRSEVSPGTLRDAILYSLGANALHGLPRSNADKRRAVETLLKDEEWSSWSDNVIAQKARVSQPFVSSIRRALTQNVLSEPAVAYQVDEDESWEETEQRAHREETENDETGSSNPPEPPAKSPTLRRGKDNVLRETKNIGRAARTSGAELDIKVDAPAPPPTAAPSVTHSREVWIGDQAVDLHIRINAGKTLQRRAVVSGRFGDGKPLFRQCTAAELEPFSGVITDLLRELKKGAARRAAKPTTTATKKKPARKK